MGKNSLDFMYIYVSNVLISIQVSYCKKSGFYHIHLKCGFQCSFCNIVLLNSFEWIVSSFFSSFWMASQLSSVSLPFVSMINMSCTKFVG